MAAFIFLTFTVLYLLLGADGAFEPGNYNVSDNLAGAEFFAWAHCSNHRGICMCADCKGSKGCDVAGRDCSGVRICCCNTGAW